MIATKGNGYPPAPSYLASPPITSAELPTAADPEAARKEMYQWFLNVDTIRITFAPEKEGIFLFKHTNYIVESKVIQQQKIVIKCMSFVVLFLLTQTFPLSLVVCATLG
jgi:sorting nexin-8